MKHRPVTKQDKKYTATSRKFDDEVNSVIKTESRTKKSLTQLSYYCFE